MVPLILTDELIGDSIETNIQKLVGQKTLANVLSAPLFLTWTSYKL